LNRPTINKINKEIWKLLEPTYFSQIPLSDICQILNKYNLVILQEDDTEWSGFLLGGIKRTEQVDFPLGWLNTKDQDGMFQKVKESMLTLSFYKMQSGKWEVIARLT
jgi:hypothetical protein